MRRLYGASPVHLIAHGVLLPVAGWAILQVVDVRAAANVAAWFLGALLLHDFVVLPAYSVLDRAAQRVRVAGVRAVSFVRWPAALSLLTLAVYWPQITGANDGNVRYLTGVDAQGELERWLLLVAGLWLASALALTVQVRRRQHLGGVGAADEHAA